MLASGLKRRMSENCEISVCCRFHPPEDMFGRHFRALCLGSEHHMTDWRTVNIHTAHTIDKTNKAIHPHFFIQKETLHEKYFKKSDTHWLHFILHCLIIGLCPGCLFFVFFYCQWTLHFSDMLCLSELSWTWGSGNLDAFWLAVGVPVRLKVTLTALFCRRHCALNSNIHFKGVWLRKTLPFPLQSPIPVWFSSSLKYM